MTSDRKISISPDVLSYALTNASENDAKSLRHATAEHHGAVPVVRSDWVSNQLIRVAAELFILKEFDILRSVVATYTHGLGSRSVSEGGSYALEVIDAFAGYENGNQVSLYAADVPAKTRHDMREHLRASTYIECWALISATDMLSVLEDPWKDVAPFRAIPWVDAQKRALQEINDTDWSKRDSLSLHVGNHKSPPHESLIGHFAIEYTVDHVGKAHRGDGNTRAHALLGQGAETVLVRHTRPFGAPLNGSALSPEIIVF